MPIERFVASYDTYGKGRHKTTDGDHVVASSTIDGRVTMVLTFRDGF